MPRRRIVVDSDDDVDDFPSLQPPRPSSIIANKPSGPGAPQAQAVADTPNPPRQRKTEGSSTPVANTATRRRKLGNLTNDASLLRPWGGYTRGTPAAKLGHQIPTAVIDLPAASPPQPRRPRHNRPRVELRTRRSRRVSDIPADESGELSTEEASVLEDVTLDEEEDGEGGKKKEVPSSRKPRRRTHRAMAATPTHSGADATEHELADTPDPDTANHDNSETAGPSSDTDTESSDSDMDNASENDASEFQDSSVSEDDSSVGSLDDFFAPSPPKRKPASATSTRTTEAAPAQPLSLPVPHAEEDSSVFFSAEESFEQKKASHTTPPAGTRQGGRTTTPPDETTTRTSSKSSGLLSPTKKLPRIPQTPHRPSTDAFWNQMVVDDWNMEHSPRKMLFDPDAAVQVKKKNPVTATATATEIASDAGRAAHMPSSPSKKTAPAAAKDKEAKKAFQKAKHKVAEDFLMELDATITKGELSRLAAATGGIRIEWTNKLNTTAGRANWRRETLRSKAPGQDVPARATSQASTAPATRVLHHASIELAEKVIDDQHRLLNVIAHEFCHLANFMVSGITGNPHGKEFKAWAAQCSRHFGERGIQVTTKHAYEIDFKYVWTCEACATEFKRHSKSIDTSRHRCGACQGMLKQTKPTPRGGGARAAAGASAGTGARAGTGSGPATTPGPSEYQRFMKEHMAAVRRENPGSPQKDIMKLVADKWTKAKQLKLSGLRRETQPGEAEAGAETKDRESGTDQLNKAFVDLTLG